MNIMSAIAPVVANPRTIWAVVAALTVWAVWSGVPLWLGVARLRAALGDARRLFIGSDDAIRFVERFEAVSEELGKNEILGSRWREFRETLLSPAGPGRPVRSTSRPNAWFDMGLLRQRGVGIDPRYHAAMPNLLVGAGLLFTFLGLAVALNSAGGIVAEGVTQTERNAALHQLLEAASFKFVTSVAGLFLSIAYALLRKNRLKLVELDLDAFRAAVEARIPLVTSAALQQDANQLLQAQSVQLETFSNELAVNIGGAFDAAFDKRLGEHIAPLTEAMQRLATGLTSRSDDGMQRMLDAFLQRLQGGTGDRMEQVAESLAGLGTRLEALQSGLGDATTRMADSADAMARRMGEGAEAALSRITDQMGGLTENLRSLAEQTRNAGADAGRELALRLEAAAAGFEGAARTVADTLSEAARGLERRMGDEAVNSSARLTGQIEAMVGELRNLAENSRAAGATALEALAERIGAAAAGFEGTAARVAEALGLAATQTGGALGRGAEEAVGRIASATEGMRTELQALMVELRGTLGQASDALREGGQAGGASLQGSLDKAGTALAGTLAGAADGLRQAGETAGAAIQRGGDTAASRIAEAGSVVGARADALGRQAAGLGERLEALAVRITDLDGVTRDSARPLAIAAADMKLAADATQGVIRPLAEVAQHAKLMLEQVSGTAQKIEAAQVTAARLAESLDTATRRFEGVDKNMAAVMSQLHDGLAQFAREVGKFVAETDSNLAKAAVQLGNMVKSLENALDNKPPPGKGR